jgi:hypothetical protein
LLWFGLAHVCLATAWVLVGLHPREIAGFFYHAQMMTVVHLITLGWITASIVGALYVVAPMALRTTLVPGPVDVVILAGFSIGLSGLVFHFWFASFTGVAWAAGLVWTVLLLFAARVVPHVLRAPIPAAIKAHLALAFFNLLAAGAVGAAMAAHKAHPYLRLDVFSLVLAHAHLAAVGWAALMVMGVAYRLLPMFLPSAPPPPARLWWSVLLVELGVAALFLGWTAWPAARPLGAPLIVLGFGAFAFQVWWMRRHPRTAAPGLEPIPSGPHAHGAGFALIGAAALGLTLSIMPMTSTSLRLAAVFGVLGLVGFLSRIVLAFQDRLLGLLSSVHGTQPRRPTHPGRQRWIRIGWGAGVPLLAAGLGLDAWPAVTAGAAFLGTASMAGLWEAARFLPRE